MNKTQCNRLRFTATLLTFVMLITFFPLKSTGGLPGHDGHGEVLVVDMHTHVFNAHDLPLNGILNSMGARLGISRILTKLINNMTHTNDPNWLVANEESAFREQHSIIENIRKNSGNENAESLFSILSEEERREFFEYIGTLENANPQWFSGDQDKVENELYAIASALDHIGFPESTEADNHHFLSPFSKLKGLIKFLKTLTRSNIEIADQLHRIEYPKVDLFIHHMMDMERSYASKPFVSFEAQLIRMPQLNRYFDGKFIHFVAYDPFRGPASLDTVKAGLLNGAIGVKFYPPSGYRPTQNKIEKAPQNLFSGARKRWESRYAHLDDKKLDDLNKKLFAYCETNSIPIFTHCTPAGFEAVKGYGKKSDPVYWACVLKQYPNLKLCFGHSGGGAYWFEEKSPQNSKAYGKEVVRLCMKYENVYCEVGYLDEILEKEKLPHIRQRLITLLNSKHPGKQWKFGEKIMYGTDWHMIDLLPDHRKYLEAFDQVFMHKDLQEWRRSFFGLNALRFLDLEMYSSKSGHTEKQKKYWEMLLDFK